MTELTENQKAYAAKLKKDASTKIPASVGGKLVAAGVAVKADEGSGQRGYGMYRAA